MPEQPDWLKTLTDEICRGLHAVDTLPPIGCHVCNADDIWEISLFVSPTEIVGGEHDGERVSSMFLVDTLVILELFDVVESAVWQPHQMDADDELRAHFAVTGVYQGRQICLRLLADTPERFAPGRYANLFEKRIMETWQG